MRKSYLEEYQKPELKIFYFKENIKTLVYASPGDEEEGDDWDDIFGNKHG